MIRKFSNRTPEQQHVGLNRSRWTLRLIGVPGVVIVLVWSSKILFPSHPQEQVLGVALRPETAVIRKVGSFSFSGWTDIKKGRIVVRKLGIWVDSPTAHDDCADST